MSKSHPYGTGPQQCNTAAPPHRAEQHTCRHLATDHHRGLCTRRPLAHRIGQALEDRGGHCTIIGRKGGHRTAHRGHRHHRHRPVWPGSGPDGQRGRPRAHSLADPTDLPPARPFRHTATPLRRDPHHLRRPPHNQPLISSSRRRCTRSGPAIPAYRPHTSTSTTPRLPKTSLQPSWRAPQPRNRTRSGTDTAVPPGRGSRAPKHELRRERSSPGLGHVGRLGRANGRAQGRRLPKTRQLRFRPPPHPGAPAWKQGAGRPIQQLGTGRCPVTGKEKRSPC